MKYNKRIIYTIAAISLTIGLANATSLVNVDLKKSSDSAIDMTFFTTDTSNPPMVTRKSNNKYVILMPNVSGAGANTPSLGAVKDLVSDIDVKNVDDGMNGYTKVTLTTTKPVNINTHTKKTAPISSEEKQAKAILAQVKTQSTPSVKPETTVQNSSKSEDTKTATVVQNNKGKALSQKTSDQTAAPKKAEIKKLVPVKASKRQEIVKTESIEHTAAPKTDALTENQAPLQSEKTIDTTEDKILVSDIQNDKNIESKQAVNDNIFNADSIMNMNYVEKVAQKASSHKKLPALFLFIIPIFGLYLMAKGLKNSVQKSDILKSSFKRHLAEKPNAVTTYDDIINDSELSWQEKYKRFVEESKDDIKSKQYHFIKKVNKTVEDKRAELENTFKKTPDIYKDTQIKIDENPVLEVQSEDAAIQENILKLKAFAKPVSLNSTQRNRNITRPVTKLESPSIGKFVELKQSELNTTSRNFRDGALSVKDLMKTGGRYIKENDMDSIQEDYVVSSADEYLSILEKEKELVTAPANLSSKVASTLSNLKPSMHIAPAAVNNASNPIKQNRSKDANGLIIKSSYNIDANRSFYIANVDGLNSLIGRINDETFVLKTFDSSVNNLQVRHDSEDVYVVKAGDYKALVNVEDDKMGVLIEL